VNTTWIKRLKTAIAIIALLGLASCGGGGGSGGGASGLQTPVQTIQWCRVGTYLCPRGFWAGAMDIDQACKQWKVLGADHGFS
jgi:hypothetical protein